MTLEDLQVAIGAKIAEQEATLRGLFPAQREASEDPCRFKAIRTPRRAGKTTTVMSRFCERALSYPGSRFPYIMLTRGQAKDVAWPVLKELSARYELDLKFNETELYATFPNGSIISLYGADKPGWMERMRGQKNRGACIDEAQGFSVDLSVMIYQVLRPTLIDTLGELWIAGTPGNIKSGIFYHVTQGTGKYQGWKVFNWGTGDNPHVREQYLEELKLIKADHPNDDITKLPWVRREYFGEWVIDESDNVYTFSPEKNSIYEWERQAGDEFVCGIDLGWNDRTAFVLGCYNESKSNAFVILESFRYPKMLIDDVVRQVHDFEANYPGVRFIADPSRRQLLEELQVRADVMIEAAERSEKKDFIELANRDFNRGAIKILNPEGSKLASELTDLKWVTRPSGKVEEHPALPNDCCDAFLYAWRRAFHYIWKEEEKKPEPGTLEYYEAEANRMFANAVRRVEKSKSETEWWDRQ